MTIDIASVGMVVLLFTAIVWSLYFSEELIALTGRVMAIYELIH